MGLPLLKPLQGRDEKGGGGGGGQEKTPIAGKSTSVSSGCDSKYRSLFVVSVVN